MHARTHAHTHTLQVSRVWHHEILHVGDISKITEKDVRMCVCCVWYIVGCTQQRLSEKKDLPAQMVHLIHHWKKYLDEPHNLQIVHKMCIKEIALNSLLVQVCGGQA